MTAYLSNCTTDIEGAIPLTLLPVYTTITVPDSTLWYQVELYKNMTGKDPLVGEKIYIIIAKEEMAIDDLGPENVYPIGVAGSITDINEQGYLVMHLDHRVRYDNMEGQGRDLTFEATALADQDDLDQAGARERLEAIKDSYRQMAKDFEWGPMSEVFIRLWQTAGDIGAAISPWLDIPNERVYALLETDSLQKRFDDLEAIIYEYTELARVRMRAQIDQKEAYQKQVKEQALRKQMEYMQRELDELHPDELDGIRKLELQVQECGMNETARKEADKVLNRLKAEGESGHEYGLLTDYLEFLVSLPWKKERFKRIRLEEAEKILDSDHFGLDKVKKRILEQIAVMQLRKKQAGSIILFVGAPGTGKTSIGQSIAKALKRKYIRVSLGGIKDEADIRGHRRTYVGAMPGRIMDGIQKSGVSNPVMILDEVDKLSQSFNGDPASALLEVLDPEQNNTFTDHYLNVPFDLSDVLFICTANSTETIPEPLLNRMEVIRFQGYTPLDKEQIAVRHLLPKAKAAAGLKDGDLDLADDVLRLIISDYTQESGVRGLKKRLDTLCRSTAVALVRGQKPPVSIQEDDLRDMLDMPLSSTEMCRNPPLPAWSRAWPGPLPAAKSSILKAARCPAPAS